MYAGRHDLAMAGLLLGMLAPGLARAQVDDPCASDHLDEMTRSRCARSLYGEREYVAAARHYERLWLDTGEPKYLYNSAAAREAAGHTASALAQWTRYGASAGVSASERAEVNVRIGEIRTRLVPVIVTVTPEEVLGPAATFWCERGEGRTQESFDIPAQLVEAAQPGSFVLHLEPGAWKLRLSPASAVSTYMTTSTSVLVVEDTIELPMPLASRPMYDEATAPRGRIARRLTLGMGGTAAVSAVLGITFMSIGSRDLDPVRVPGDLEPKFKAIDEARRSLEFVGAGAGFIGAAVGFGVAAGLETLPPTRRRHGIQLGTGAGITVVGIVWYAFARTSYNAHLAHEAVGCSSDADCVRSRRVTSEQGHRGVSGVLLGAGASLMAGASASYLLRVWLPRRRHRITVGGLLRPHTAGVVLHGSF